MANLLQFRTRGHNSNLISTPIATTSKNHSLMRERLPVIGAQNRASLETNLHSHNSVFLYSERRTHAETASLRRSSQKPSPRFPVNTAVNPKRHTSCKVPIDQVEFRPGMTNHIEWQHSFIAQRNNTIFHYPEKPPGTKLNLVKAERTYSSKNLIEIKRKQYMQRLNQNRRAFLCVSGSREDIYTNYMRYINQPKTAQLPLKYGWRRPTWLPESVNRGKDTKDNSQKQQEKAKKAFSSSNMLKKSQTFLFKNSNPKLKKEVKVEMLKSPKEPPRPPDQAVRRPQRSISSFIPPPNGSSENAKSLGSSENATSLGSSENPKSLGSSENPKSLGSQGSTHKSEDVHSKGELKESFELDAEAEGENYDKPLSYGNQNHQQETRRNMDVDKPMSLQGHLSPTGSTHEEIKTEDQKSVDLKLRGSTPEMVDINQADEMVDINQADEMVNINQADEMVNINQADEMVNINDADDFSLSAVEKRPDSRKSVLSKVHENLQETEEQSGSFKQSEYVDEKNKMRQEQAQPLDTVSQESEKSTSSQVLEMKQEVDQESTGLQQREHVDEMDKESQEHSYHLPTVATPESGQDNSTNVHGDLQEDQKSTEMEQSESAHETVRSQEHEARAFLAGRPDSVHENLADKDQKSADIEQGLATDNFTKESQEQDSRPSTARRPGSGKSSSRMEGF